MNGALTIQVVKATTPDSAVELNVRGRPDDGLSPQEGRTRRKSNQLAQYTIFWHHPNGKCVGDAGWVKNPPQDTSGGSDGTSRTADDPRTGVRHRRRCLRQRRRRVAGPTSTITYTFADGSTVTQTTTTNPDGSVTVTRTCDGRYDDDLRHSAELRRRAGRHAREDGSRVLARNDPAVMRLYRDTNRNLETGLTLMNLEQLTARRRDRGFTLIDLVIAIAIVAILMRIAFPSYQAYIVRSSRPVGAGRARRARQSRRRRSSSTPTPYTSSVTGAYTGQSTGGLGLYAPRQRRRHPANRRTTGTQSRVAATATTFTLTATPKAGTPQAGDGNLTITEARACGPGARRAWWRARTPASSRRGKPSCAPQQVCSAARIEAN